MGSCECCPTVLHKLPLFCRTGRQKLVYELHFSIGATRIRIFLSHRLSPNTSKTSPSYISGLTCSGVGMVGHRHPRKKALIQVQFDTNLEMSEKRDNAV